MEDKILIVDSKNFTGKLPKDLAVEGDNKSTKITFKLPKIVGGVDVTGKNIYVAYKNMVSGISYIYDCINIHYDGDYIICDWYITREATAFAGTVSFHLEISDGDYIWKSNDSSFEVNECCIGDVSKVIDYEPTWLDAINDVISQAKADIAESVVNAAESEANAAESVENAAGYAAEAKKSAESAANSLEDLKNTVINIHNSNEGNVVSVADASDKKIEEINVFGKSTQANMPTMDEPVLIANNFDNLKVTIYIANKNLLAVPYTKDNPLTLTSDKDDYNKYYASYPFYAIAGETYTFSFESDGNAGGTTGTDTVQAGLFDTTNNIHYMTTGNKYLTFVAKKTGKCIFRCDVNKDGCTHSFWNFKVEVGDVNTDYATGEKQSIDVTLTEPLRGVVVNSGGNYTDNAGQEYLADVVCIKDGQIGVLRYVNYVRLTSSGFTLFREYDSENKISFQKSLGSEYYNESGLCTHLKFTTDYNVNTMRLADRHIIVTVSSNYTLDTFKEFLDNNEVYLAVTCKNNPGFEQFNEETQAKFKELMTYYSIANVYNNEGAFTKLNYVADTKLYIDKKIEEVAKAIVAIGSEV